MEYVQRVSKTVLARETRQVMQAVQRGQTVVVESHGQPEAAIMDITDYYLLRAVLQFHTQPPEIEPAVGLSDEAVAALGSTQERIQLVIASYLAGAISLSRAAELLAMPPLDLRVRFLRLDVPLRAGPADEAELLSDLENAAAVTPASS